jgi:MFS family permease
MAPMTSPPRSFAALRHAGFRGYFAWAALAMMADNIEHVISYWILYEKFRSPALGGVAVVTHWLPFLLLSVHSGALADRFDPRRLIQIAMALFMAVSLAWAVLFYSGTAEIWHAVVLLSLHGIAGVLWLPAAQLLVHDIVGHAELQSAVRLTASARYLGLVLGPAAGAGLMLALGPPLGLAINAAIYLPLVIWAARAARPRSRSTAAHGIAEVRVVLAAARRDGTMVSMTLLAGAASMLVGNAYHAQMPGYAQDLGHQSADFTYGVLLAADAAGALAAGVALEARGMLQSSARSASVLCMLWCLALFGFALATSYPLAVLLLFAAGFFDLAFYSMAQTLVQLRSPAELRGRLVGLFNMAALGMRAFSGVTVGVFGAAVGIHWSLAISTALMLAASIALWTRVNSATSQ